eukprot:CAMPEP_0173104676 /NCGR_PEP_ID=MMETSP1102-20130122/39450_1 /TAXON_ID=49646 /ORGANISM="Geminigera sp., Strain Caron Lab Isolate" /LENGTH=75 /DNA_ID=CAMNT_0014000373 /DNA_START=24 /DNA_END=248 /DNA_ORIENTATION=-
MENIPRWVNRFARTANRAERAKDKTKEGLRELKNGIKGLFTHRSKDDSHVLRPDAGDDHGPMLASRLPPRPSTPP